MFALARAPTHIYNTDNTVKIEKLEREVDRYKKANKKLRMIASWNLRAAQSAFKDSENILQILDDLYGDDAYENLSN